MARSAHLARIGAAALAAAVAVAVAVAVAAAATAIHRRGDGRAAAARLVSELVNDHLRQLASARAADLESDDPRVLERWLAGRLDFAPAVPLAPGTGLRLSGAALGYVFDRKAAVVVYGLRLHRLSLLAFHAGGLAWPAAPDGGPRAGQVDAAERGFHAVLWRDGELGYALVSDSGAAELGSLAQRLAASNGAEASR